MKKLQQNNKNSELKKKQNITKKISLKNFHLIDKKSKFTNKKPNKKFNLSLFFAKKKIKNRVLFFKIPNFFKSKIANRSFLKKINSQISLSKVKFKFKKKLLKKSRIRKVKKHQNKFFENHCFFWKNKYDCMIEQ